jgi:hypothetical protein
MTGADKLHFADALSSEDSGQNEIHHRGTTMQSPCRYSQSLVEQVVGQKVAWQIISQGCLFYNLN